MVATQMHASCCQVPSHRSSPQFLPSRDAMHVEYAYYAVQGFPCLSLPITVISLFFSVPEFSPAFRHVPHIELLS